MIYTATLDAKRRVCLPVEICNEVGLKKGSKITITLQNDGTIAISSKQKMISKINKVLFELKNA